jgi:hypothetical protein
MYARCRIDGRCGEASPHGVVGQQAEGVAGIARFVGGGRY